jgi:hypothetical protein
MVAIRFRAAEELHEMIDKLIRYRMVSSVKDLRINKALLMVFLAVQLTACGGGGGGTSGSGTVGIASVVKNSGSVGKGSSSTAKAATGNLAQGAAAYAWASSVEKDRLSADAAIDGNSATRWSSAFSDKQWIAVDLGAVYSINHVVLNWEAAYGKGYRIEVSTDGTTWNPVFSVTNGNGGIDDLVFGGTNARYVRMWGTTRGTPYGYSLYEFEVYGPGGGSTAGDGTSGGSTSDSGTTTTVTSTAPVTGTATTGSLALSWKAPVARADGTPLSLADIDGYRIHYGKSSGNYTGHFTLADGTAQTLTLTGLPVGTYYLVMTTYDVDGRESGYSSQVSKIVQ